MQKIVSRVVGIEPTVSGFAYAILDGPTDLRDWGRVYRAIPSDASIMFAIGRTLDQVRPGAVVLEDGRGSRRRERHRRLVKAIAITAKKRKIKVTYVSRSLIRTILAPATTKQEIAVAVARRFRGLSHRLPRPRQPWTSEDARMSIFDAVSFALASFSK